MSEPWMDSAACAGHPQDWWFMEGQFELGKKICRTCPVRKECRQAGDDNQETYGLWGGLTPEERGFSRWRHKERLAKRRAS